MSIKRQLQLPNTFFIANHLLQENVIILLTLEIKIKGLDPLRAKKTFIRKKLDHTMVSAIKASSVTL